MLARGDEREGDGPVGCLGGPTRKPGDAGRDGGGASRGLVSPHGAVPPCPPKCPCCCGCPAASWAASHLHVRSAPAGSTTAVWRTGSRAAALPWEAPPGAVGRQGGARSCIHSPVHSLAAAQALWRPAGLGSGRGVGEPHTHACPARSGHVFQGSDFHSYLKTI